ncbi:myosin N-terminal SH3-like domain-containing protein, partial [Salmonella sp. s51228]|uniref:myosin N-terminal SH3-like domain-containing protein n=1 Tax=Salmonella sp. s51228 TaxID=3159652 RepID=UPI00397EC1DB
MADESDEYLHVAKTKEAGPTAGFDTKKSCWVPCEKEGFIKAEVISTKGDMVTVKTITGKQVTLKKDDTQQMNPPKFEKIEDMAGMTYLTEAGVLHNL